MKGKYILVLALVLTTSATLSAQVVTIARYKEYNGYAVSQQGDSLLILRSFLENSIRKYLLINSYTLRTTIVEEEGLMTTRLKRPLLVELFRNTPYIKALKVAEYTSDKVTNAGVRRFQRITGGVDLTIDLCPSKLPLDREFFVEMVKSLSMVQKPVPMAISVTGTWMKGHPSDFVWLLDRVKAGEIDITWINHSYSHRFNIDLPLKENFLLEKGTNLRSEILRTEITMLEHGVIPSPFFRFPGLISDKAVFDAVLSYGLIPIGTDAWLAKRQFAKMGSIVLVHANGNEPLGLKKFQKLLETQRDSILAGKWMLFDLRESMATEPVNK
ncbi:polysaccharide deacetylase family protein [Williamwhitmania taraxaci]|uniref:Polysaccharide deacetylase n=1 Tax=Williamwhitmania taraxaci TaxID=1640674 RepID=A0A1G6HBX2_9BACT|nr:hypothetical protein [Williamwhitmania taraxaci]SDB91445.1 hypothetical protein SAMN05216323_10097 [Williamwhitmania taraxaci]